VGGVTEPPGLDDPLLSDGGGVTVERGDEGDEADDVDDPLVFRRLMVVETDILRVLEDGERSEEPRMRWLYLHQNG
jgi:hypothetical protein